MKAVTIDGKTIEIRPGMAITGTQLVSVEITYDDLFIMKRTTGHDRFIDWIESSLLTRLVPVDPE